MKFTIQGPIKENIYNLMRGIGYFYLPEKSSELSFVRPMERSGYPRFHIYLKVEKEDLIFNLHLDQKRPIYPVRSPSHCERNGKHPRRLTSNKVYKGAPAHAAEYKSAVVEKEAERIKQILQE